MEHQGRVFADIPFASGKPDPKAHTHAGADANGMYRSLAYKAFKRFKKPFWHSSKISEKFGNKIKIVKTFRFQRFLFEIVEISGIEPLTS